MLKQFVIATLLLLTQSSLAAPPHGGVLPTPPGQPAIQQLMATMPNNSMQLLNGTFNTGGQPVDALTGTAAGTKNLFASFPNAGGVSAGCYWSLHPGPSCVNGYGDPTGSDAFPTDLAAQNGPGSGANYSPTCFTSPAVDMTAGAEKSLVLWGGGHLCNMWGAVYRFDLEAAAQCMVNEGGWTKNPCGQWTLPIQPSRIGDPHTSTRPSYSSQFYFTCVASWGVQLGPTSVNATFSSGSGTITMASSVNGLWEVGEAVVDVSGEFTGSTLFAPLTLITGISSNGLTVSISPNTIAAGTAVATLNIPLVTTSSCAGVGSFTPAIGNTVQIHNATGIAGATVVNSSISTSTPNVGSTIGISVAATQACTNCTLTFSNSQWFGTNNQGIEVPGPGGHHYRATIIFDSGRYAIAADSSLDQGLPPFGGTAQQYIYDDQLKTLNRVFTANDTATGYSSFCSFYPQGVVWDPVSHNLYCAGVRNGYGVTAQLGLVVWSDPRVADPTVLGTPTSTFWSKITNEMIEIPDAVAVGKNALFEAGIPDGTNASTCRGFSTQTTQNLIGFNYWIDVNDYATPSISCMVATDFANASGHVLNGCGYGLLSSAYDATRGVIFMHCQEVTPTTLYSVTPNNNPPSWTISTFETASTCANAHGSGSCATFGPQANGNAGGPPTLGILADGSGAIVSVNHPNTNEQEYWLWKF